jgi:glycogen operon protein
MAATVFSLGTPMLLAGDDIGHSQQGNNNAYCQDNASTWLDWPDADHELSRFVSHLFKARNARQVLQARAWWQAGGPAGTVTANWSMPDGSSLTPEAWNDGRQRALTLHLSLEQADSDDHFGACLLLINASDAPVQFRLPTGNWLLHIDTHSGTVTDQAMAAVATIPAGGLWLASSHPLFIASRQP